ncbi:P-loop ATPase, Sll1717 family [Leptospira yasudae]|uniref:ATPase n=1 Tax=Leptospira yasudae TaxID=2202201 RepID=A0ABX9LX79_9LEPT|nr:hypothetical protein [Leptospira yasudae]RHX77460.1 hypothetical protein DLM77_21045 [Leptospira yasudae]
MKKEKIITLLNFGSRVAEEEMEHLQDYFVETDNWSRFLNGDIDIVYGAKGSGKSAIYLLLLKNKENLYKSKNTVILNAEHLRGKTAFAQLEVDPPTSEVEFISLWKLYFVTLIANYFSENGIKASFLRDFKDAGLIKQEADLSELVSGISRIIRNFRGPKALEAGTVHDPRTGQSEFFTRIVLDKSKKEISSTAFDGFLSEINKICQSKNLNFWIALDRLDVAFSDNLELEANAIRALFRVYLDLNGYSQIKLKLFVRTDIWQKITEIGFREGSHLTRSFIIEWTKEDIIALILNRVFKTKDIRSFYNINGKIGLEKPKERERLFYKLFPPRVEGGKDSKKTDTITWIISRTQDGSRNPAPREIIHLLTEARNEQVKSIESGGRLPTKTKLLDSFTFRNALPKVSKVRTEQSLYSEFPRLKSYIVKLENEKTEQSIGSLSKIWQCTKQDAIKCAEELISIGFFERRGAKDAPLYWIPFVFRSALRLVQGKSEFRRKKAPKKKVIKKKIKRK